VTDHLELRSGAYHDSVSLMQVSRQVAGTSGVAAAQVAMATELNLEVIAAMGFSVPPGVQPNELVVAIRADDPDGVAAGLAALDAALAGLRSAGSGAGGFGEAPPPRTLGRAVLAGDATLALVSVPGQHATVEAFDAIARGVSVMVFSDNVPVEDEVRLKDAAAAQDVLVMGPDCGTAVVGGVALGFANVVSRGPVGIVAASGTGAQQVMALLDAAGVGVSHCLGVGGRDLSAAVGGRSTRQALAALAADEATEAILVVSKPPAAEVLAELEGYAAGLGTPVHWATLGAGRPDLTAAVEAFLGSLGREVPSWPSWEPLHVASSEDPQGQDPVDLPNNERWLRGLFCGGTLADEAMLVAAEELGVGIRSNIPLSPDLALGADLRADAHVVIDFGDDELTRGRAHPMIDPTLRLERIAAEAADPGCGVLLLDLVLGHGAHPDPAPELAEAIRDARAAAGAAGRDLPVVVSLTGTRGDPQGLDTSGAQLSAAGASVHLSNAQATRHALARLAGDRPADHAGDPDGDPDGDHARNQDGGA
jgi:FdrA protein